MNESLESQIDTFSYMIDKGKPCALVAIQDRYVSEAELMVETAGLKCLIVQSEYGWSNLWIYKHDIMLEVITNLPEPTSAYNDWILGHAFGYSDHEILNWITSRKYD